MKAKFAQTSMTDEIVVDGFAGGGGWSTGFELAAGRPVNIAINHDPDAIVMHETNHPHTEHYCENIFAVDPMTATRGRPVGWAHFSPDCKHFSRAKGSPLVDQHIRGLAWVVLRWADQTRPRIISMENVLEFTSWGPLIPSPDGKGMTPDPERAGETFKAFIGMLTTGVSPHHPAVAEMCDELGISPDSPMALRLIKGLGYKVEWRELVAADYGAPTIRKRLFILARCDGRPIVWPEPTHAKADSEEVKAGNKKPWRSAAEIIDWTLTCPSIFDDKATIKAKHGLTAQRPLADNTLCRVAQGLDKFVIKNNKPFIIPIGYGERSGQAPRVHDIADPLPTCVGSAKHGVVEPYMVQVNHAGGDFRGQELDQPLKTVTAKHGYGVAEPMLAPWTCTNTGSSTGHPADEPIGVAKTGGGGGQMFMGANLVQYHTEQSERVRGQSVEDPVMTIDASPRYALEAVTLTQYNSKDLGQDADAPLHTITTKDREGVIKATFIQVHHAGGYHGKGNLPTSPINTVTASGGISLEAAHMVKLKGDNIGEKVTDPLPTILANGKHHGLVVTKVVKVVPGVDLHRWPEVRALLNTYCDYQLADDEIILFRIDGAWYFIADIGLRMLTAKELYRANGFPEDYIIERDYKGNVYGKTKQVARCGNAVPPPFATALVRANAPEWCNGKHLTTMREFMEEVAV